MGRRDQFVRVEVEIKHETELALLCVVAEDGREIWIPKSQVIEAGSEVFIKGDVGTLAVTEWLAEKEGLV